MTVFPGGRVVVVIPAHREAERIGATVRAAAGIAGVRRVLVVDDGSDDGTGRLAAAAGATVLRHRRNRGKGAALTTGLVATAGGTGPGPGPEAVLLLDADLGETAAAAGPLLPPVLSGEAAMSVALLPPAPGGGGRGRVVRLARRGIRDATGFVARQPLSGQRCLSRPAVRAAVPLAAGFGAEVGLTLDVMRAGLAVCEVEVPLRHRVTGADLPGRLHRGRQLLDVARVLTERRALPRARDRRSGG